MAHIADLIKYCHLFGDKNKWFVCRQGHTKASYDLSEYHIVLIKRTVRG